MLHEMFSGWKDGEIGPAQTGRASTRTIALRGGGGQKKRRAANGGGGVEEMAFRPEGKTRATGGDDYRVRLWNVPEWKDKSSAPRRNQHPITSSAAACVLRRGGRRSAGPDIAESAPRTGP